MTCRSRHLGLGYGALSLVDAVLAGRPGPRARVLRRITKPLLMPTLAAATLAGRSNSPARGESLVALAAGCIGDTALMRPGPTALGLGAGAFAVGHVAWLRAFAPELDPDWRSGAPARGALALWSATLPIVVLAGRREHPALGPLLAAYSALLIGTAAATASLDRRQPADARRAATAGGALFLVSDTLLGLRFLRPGDPGLQDVAVMATYTAAQGLLARGAARLVAGDTRIRTDV